MTIKLKALRLLISLVVVFFLASHVVQASETQTIAFRLSSTVLETHQDIFFRLAHFLNWNHMKTLMVVSHKTKKQTVQYIESSINNVIHALLTFYPETNPGTRYDLFNIFKTHSFKLPDYFATPLPILWKRGDINEDYLLIQTGNPILAYANSQVAARYEWISLAPLLLREDCQTQIFGKDSGYSDTAQEIITCNITQLIGLSLYKNPEAYETDVYAKVWRNNRKQIINAACSVYNDRIYIEYSHGMQVTNHPNSYFVIRDKQLDAACKLR